MFRRRTDRIYATLQQVQRRITQGTESGTESGHRSSHGPGGRPPDPWQGRTLSQASLSSGNTGYMVTPDGRRYETTPDERRESRSTPTSQTQAPPPAPAPAAPPPPVPFADRPLQGTPPPGPPVDQWGRDTGALRQADAPVPQQPNPSYTGYQQAQQPRDVPANPALDLAASAGRRRPIAFSKEMAGVLLILWIGTVGVAWLLGFQYAKPPTEVEPGSLYGPDSPLSEGRSMPADDRGVRVEGGQATGDQVLILMSAGSSTPAVEERYRAQVDKLNDFLRGRRYPALFGVRYPSSGRGIQFVYGRHPDGSYGISRDDISAKLMKWFKDQFGEPQWIQL